MEYQLKNPFAYSALAEGENFIGRKELLSLLKNAALKGEQTHVQGLPRMGKSSLIRRCFLEKENYRWWVEDQKKVPLYIDDPSAPKDLWYTIACKVNNALTDLSFSMAIDNKIIQACERLFTLNGANDRHAELIRILSDIQNKLDLQYLFIIDEFDLVLDYAYTKEDFKKLKTLSNYGTIITCSRRRASFIEQSSSNQDDFCWGKKELYVGVFTPDDVNEYWSHYRDYFKVLDDNQMQKYKSLVSKYAGCQPQLMNYMNSQALDHNDLIAWCNGNQAKRNEIELGFRVYVKNLFAKHMKKVEEQGLRDAAINLVTNSLGKVTEEEKSLLLNYTFINAVPSNVKKEVFGVDLGLLDGEGNRYVCMSEFTSHLLYEEYEPSFSLYEWLVKTEVELRELVRKCITMQCPNNPFVIICGNRDDDIEYKEKWEDAFMSRIPYYDEKVERNFIEMKHTRAQREANSTLPLDKRTGIDLISSTTLGNLWNIFIKWQWNSYYGKVFDAKNSLHISNNFIYRGNKQNREEWYKTVYDPVRVIRNAESHRNLEDHSEEHIKQVEEKCMKICKDIDNWKKECVK